MDAFESLMSAALGVGLAALGVFAGFLLSVWRRTKKGTAAVVEGEAALTEADKSVKALNAAITVQAEQEVAADQRVKAQARVAAKAAALEVADSKGKYQPVELPTSDFDEDLGL